MSGVHRAFAALLLAVLMIEVSVPLTCAGWEPAATDRMACCKRAAHEHCGDQQLADSCCAGQEQTHQPGATIASSVSAVPILALAVFTPAFEFRAVDAQAARRFQPALAHRFHSPPGLLGPPLRI
jgi:hypothetical protein